MFIDLTGQIVHRLTVIKQDLDRSTVKRKYWICTCSCGGTASVRADGLRSAKVKSCGCLHKDFLKTKITHGMSKTLLYKTWHSMIERCSNKTNTSWTNYGDRGIKVCARWRDSFQSFYDDMGEKPTASHSIERHDNNKGYNPCNCYWATNKAQSNNKRTNHNIFIGGRTKTLTQWCDHFNIAPESVHRRINKGFTPQDAITKPMIKNEHLISVNGINKSLAYWCKKFDVRSSTVIGRINRGWCPEKAITTPTGKTGRKRVIQSN